jgi:hypothetical protein
MEKETTVMTNRQFSLKNDLFERCCNLARVQQTTRQASKFRMGRGKAFAMKADATREEDRITD